MGTRLKFGLLLPHFGRNASFQKILNGVKRAEEYGFDSVWVRDHLVFRPHDFEPQGFDSQDTTHITYFESFVTLAAVAASENQGFPVPSMILPPRIATSYSAMVWLLASSPYLYYEVHGATLRVPGHATQ